MREKTLDLVLIPGMNNTARVWRETTSHFPEWINSLCVDCPAYDDINRIADELVEGLPVQFYLCGLSFGGYVALSIVDRYPERVKGLILTGSSADADTPEQSQVREAMVQRTLLGEYQQLVDSIADKVFHPDSLKRDSIRKARQEMVHDYGADRFVAHQQACIARSDRRHVLHNRSLPLLVVAGSDDKVIPCKHQRTLADMSCDAHFESIDTAGHLLPLEQPLAFATALEKWLAATTARNI